MLKLIFFLQCLLGVISQNLSTLEFVQIWFRHGERLPTHYITFPNEPPLDFDYREIAELGELTTRGVQQEYQVGSYIRDYYGPFFNYTYRPSEVHIWTGKDNRTVASALALVAGVYPPIGAQIWNATLNWQPVVVHTDETIDWVSTGIENECPMFEKNFFASPGFQSTLSDVDPHFIEFLRNNTGAPIDEPIDFNRVIDSLKVKLYMNDSRIPFPKWAEPIKNKIEAVHSRYHSTVIDLQNTTMGAYQMELLMSYFEDHLNRPDDKKNRAVFIAGHDTNIMALGRSLKIPEISDSLVAYAAHLTVELHMINGIKYIELWFAANVTNKRKQVLIPECGNPCPMMKLQEITKGRRPTRSEMVMECRGIGIIGEQSGVLTGSMILVLGILVLSTLILLCTTCSYRKQLKNLQDPERRSLLNTNS